MQTNLGWEAVTVRRQSSGAALERLSRDEEIFENRKKDKRGAFLELKKLKVLIED